MTQSINSKQPINGPKAIVWMGQVSIPLFPIYRASAKAQIRGGVNAHQIMGSFAGWHAPHMMCSGLGVYSIPEAVRGHNDPATSLWQDQMPHLRFTDNCRPSLYAVQRMFTGCNTGMGVAKMTAAR